MPLEEVLAATVVSYSWIQRKRKAAFPSKESLPTNDVPIFYDAMINLIKPLLNVFHLPLPRINHDTMRISQRQTSYIVVGPFEREYHFLLKFCPTIVCAGLSKLGTKYQSSSTLVSLERLLPISSHACNGLIVVKETKLRDIKHSEQQFLHM